MYKINIPLPTPSHFHVGYCFPEIKKKKRKEKKTLKDTGHCETHKTVHINKRIKIIIPWFCSLLTCPGLNCYWSLHNPHS